jgi:hypothetical protein
VDIHILFRDSLEEESHLTPIPVDTDISSLSAILMNDDYYNFTIEYSQIGENIPKKSSSKSWKNGGIL